MGHALVQHLALALTALLAAGCIGAKGNDRHPPPARTTAHVSPTGDDAATGEKATPFKTIAKALAGNFDRIVLLRGAHDEERIHLDRPVSLEGDGPVVVRGHVFVKGSEVTIKEISIGGGLSADFARDLRVENATIAAGGKDDAVSLNRSSVAFTRVRLNCGPLACLHATTSTTNIEGCIGVGQAETQRVLRFEESRARIARCRLERSSVAHLQVSTGSQVEASDLVLLDGSNGVVVGQGASLIGKRLVVERSGRMSLVGQRAKLEIEDSTFGATPDQTIGLSGVEARFRRTIVEGSPKGAVSVIDHSAAGANVRFEGGEIRHGAASGILVASGEVTISGVRFVGKTEPKKNGKNSGNDAITANGLDARVKVESAVFEAPGGFAVAFHSDASGSVTATIAAPGLGGVLVEDAAAEPVVIAKSVMTGCLTGSGVVVTGAGQVVVDRTRVEGCKEAGVLAGEKANVTVSGSAFSKNAMYGVAAFGDASVSVSGSRIGGSKFATFASCGDGARIDDRGSNRFDGAVSACP